ncbi:hypothetical protein PTKU64_33730 [Paraburkholderia terrae]|uniref:Uncharacterized protein n=1 Tax=Paraburkholderia terrae TaxID=311230 RepID=A0ABM7TMN9_9BURK|nr:hypothetical protein PTKU64_33730 [Paraburkholderia terrae]BDC41834.1 hypothetical protein PTKU15_51310 [Paraburkholderia terrae]
MAWMEWKSASVASRMTGAAAGEVSLIVSGLLCRGWKALTMPAACEEMKRVKNGGGVRQGRR